MNRNQGKSLVGYRLDKYEIHAEIGRGGMGAVYKGYDPLLDRYLAVKVLAPHLVWEKEFVQRFLREARSAARLKHPSIVTIHDVGQQDGWYYFVMEYVEGIALNQFIKQHGALPVCDALEVVQALASALDYAHAKGLIHRDIKPGNIIVGVGGEITLTDFGIARAAQEKRMTSTGTILGTPEYMAPEQAKGEGADARSDLYSLAMVAYQMLSGAVPYDADSTLALLYKVVNNPLPPIRQYQPDIPEAVETVLQRALAKDPAARYPNVTAFYEALRTAFGELPQMASLIQNVRPEDVSVVAPPPVEEVSSWSESDMRQAPTRIEGATPAPERPVTPPPVTPPPPTTPPPAPQPEPEMRSSETVIEEAEAEAVPQPTPAADEQKRRVPVWVWGAIGAIVLLCGAVGGGMATGLIGATPTPTETATPTLTATSTPAPMETDTSAATSTPAATSTDLPTPTPMQSPTPTEEPTDTPTPTPDLPTRTPAPQAVPPQLIAPASGESTGGTVTFSWTGTLGQGQTYQVTAYTSGYTAQSEALTVNTWTANLPAEHFGEWRWRVSVIQNGNAVETSPESTFWLDPGFGGGDGGDGGGGDDDGGGGQEPTPKPTPKP